MARTVRVDPLFAGIAKAIYGDVDPRELLAKATPDPSDVHVDQNVGAPAMPNPKDQKRLAATGLAATGIAGVAGLHAITATLKENTARSAAAAAGADIGRGARLVRRVTRLSPTKAAAVAGGAALGLHGVELLGDSLAAHAQIGNIRQANRDQSAHPVSKAVRLRALNAADGVGRRVPSLRAKRPKAAPLPATPTSTAGLYQPVAKGVLGELRRTVRNADTIAAKGVDAASDAAITAHRVKRLVPSRTTAALVGAGAVGGVGAATGTGAYLGAKAAQPNAAPAPTAPPTGSPAAPPAAPPAANTTVPAPVMPAPAGTVGKALDVVWTGEISKVDTDKRQVFGWASVSEIDGRPVVDLQGDIMPIEEVEKAAYTYVLESRKGGDMHRRVSKLYEGTEPLHTADLIESFVVTPEKLSKMGLAPDALPIGWWVGFHVNDEDQWQKVKSRERTGFSVHGSGTREPVSKADTPQRSLREKAQRALAMGKADTTLRERAEQAVHPPAVKLHPVASSFIASIGYQPQTRRLSYRMKSNPDREYTYRVKPSAGVDALTADSKGRYFATQVRGKANRSTRYTPADRLRLFADPQVSKAMPAPPVSPTAGKVAAAAAAPAMPVTPKVLKPVAPATGAQQPALAPPAKPPMFGGKVAMP